jgi:methylase of polypeptide subunit release factors
MYFEDEASAIRRRKPHALRNQHVKPTSSDRAPLYDREPARQLIAKHRALKFPYICKFGNAVLEIPEGVFCPTLAKASGLLLDVVPLKSAERVLDVFSGSGAFGINAALAGASAVTVDISALAVTSTRRNAVLNHVEDRVDARLGAMDECVSPGETFGVIIANPPLLPGEQSDPITMSIFDPGLHATTEFIRVVGRHLSPDGRCYLVTSDVIERYGYDVDRLCFESGLSSYVAAKLDVGYETYRVHEITLDQVRDENHRAGTSR